MDRWVSKTAVVTGASAGIGSDIAVALAKAGMVVIAAARRLDKLEELASKISSEKGRIVPFKCDVGQEADLESLMEFAKETNGGVDVFINNAGLMPLGTITDGVGEPCPMKDVEDCFKINVISVINGARLAVRDMKARNVKGQIIIINSVIGVKSVNPGYMKNNNVYSVSKHAVTDLVDLLRLECSYTDTPIRVTSLSPGAVDTDMLRSMGSATSGVAKLTGEDIAATILSVLTLPDHVNICEITVQAVGSKF